MVRIHEADEMSCSKLRRSPLLNGCWDGTTLISGPDLPERMIAHNGESWSTADSWGLSQGIISGKSGSTCSLLQMQRLYGNRYVQRMLALTPHPSPWGVMPSYDRPDYDRQHVGVHTLESLDRPDETDLEGEMSGEVVGTFSPACFDGGGESRCNPDTGNYDIVSNGNTCCTHECTQGHEQVHVNDLSDCCQSLKAALAAGGDRASLIRKYNDWMSAGALAWSECNAHSFSVSCLEQMSAKNSCDSQSSQCCQDLSDDLASHRRTKSSWCARAPSGRPACPF